MRHVGTAGKSRSECLCQKVKQYFSAAMQMKNYWLICQLIDCILLLFKPCNHSVFAMASVQGYYLPLENVPGDKCLRCPENGICNGKMAVPFPAPVGVSYTMGGICIWPIGVSAQMECYFRAKDCNLHPLIDIIAWLITELVASPMLPIPFPNRSYSPIPFPFRPLRIQTRVKNNTPKTSLNNNYHSNIDAILSKLAVLLCL